jgi:hypothetical protein
MLSTRVIVIGLLGLGLDGALAADAPPPCGHSLDSAPRTVQSTLTPAYADSKVDLKAVSKHMNGLMLEIGRCQAYAQDPDNDTPNRQHDIAEWQSLNQWMYRLTSFVDQNARGDHHMDWKREFELFQDVYELKR